MSLLNQLINEIAALTGLTTEEVTQRFTQDQLDEFLTSSICEQPDLVAPIFDDPNSIPCKEDTSSDLVRKLGPNLQQEADNFPKTDPPIEQFNGVECIDAVDEVNKEVEKMIRTYNDHTVLVNRLYELQDNLIPFKFYYEERSKRIAYILNDFAPPLKEIKRLESEKNKIEADNKILKEKRNALIDNVILSSSNKSEYDSYQSLIDINNSKLSTINKDISNLKDILKNKTEKYPTLNSLNLTNNGISSSSETITSPEVNSISLRLKKYSEYIQVTENGSFNKAIDVLTNPRIHFTLNFQNLNSIKITRENVNKSTGERTTYDEDFLIKNSPLLKVNSFFNGVPGYTIKNIESKEVSTGSLYTHYYNKFNDPINEFFTLDERGLTNNSNLVDPQLKGGPAEKKKEGDKEYYIKDLNSMQDFYKEFESKFKERTRIIRENVTGSEINDLKNLLIDLARRDIDLIVRLSSINLSLPEDDANLRTLLDNISMANQKFSIILTELNNEIARIESIIEENKPNSDKIKLMLKAKSSKCFDNIPDSDDAGCPDIHSERGKDPFFETLKECDPTFPNFSQLCYWKEFSKLALIQGLFPMPQDARTLRYWPVGFIIPTPAKLIKIPLPMIWTPLIVISTTAGVLVFFLNINGIFISPMVFVVTSSGYKQHLMTIRGSSKKFGYDSEDETFKPLIKLPLSVVAAKDIAKIKSIKAEDVMNEEDRAKINIATEKKKEAEASGDIVKAKKAEKEIVGIKQSAIDAIKTDNIKMKEASEKGESIDDIIQDAKTSIFKSMDDLGNPDLNNINALKQRSAKRANELKQQKLDALKRGDSDTVDRINEDLKNDGLNIEDKKRAYISDLMNYYNNVTFPKVIIPKESDKINPKPVGNDETNNKSQEMSSRLDKEFQSDHASKVKTMIGLNIAKHKEEIESKANFKVINVDANTDEVKNKLKGMASTTKDKILAKDAPTLDPKTVSSELTGAKDNVDNATNSEQIKKANNKLNQIQKSTSDKLELERAKHLLSFTAASVAALGAYSLSLDAFASCCKRDTFVLSLAIPAAIGIAVGAGFDLILSKIDGMNTSELKSLFGGKSNITPRDMRLGLLSLSNNIIPDDLSIPKPSINLDSAINMFSGLLNSISIPQVKFPSSLGKFQLDSKKIISLNIVKSSIGGMLEEYLNNNILTKVSQSLDTDFMNINPSDIKESIKSFINSLDEPIRNKIKPTFDIINSAKNANGTSLNIIEDTVFKIGPIGPGLKKIFETKALAKMQLKKPDFQFVLDDSAIKAASKILKASINPIVSSPLGYAIVAAAGVSGNLDSIRKMHPILNQDDIPPWERLTLKNILFLVFLDEFLYYGAEQTGFYRSFL